MRGVNTQRHFIQNFVNFRFLAMFVVAKVKINRFTVRVYRTLGKSGHACLSVCVCACVLRQLWVHSFLSFTRIDSFAWEKKKLANQSRMSWENRWASCDRNENKTRKKNSHARTHPPIDRPCMNLQLKNYRTHKIKEIIQLESRVCAKFIIESFINQQTECWRVSCAKSWCFSVSFT